MHAPSAYCLSTKRWQAAVIAVLLPFLATCATTRRPGHEVVELSTMWYDTRDEVHDFKNAIAYFGYHESTIAPAQIMDSPPLTYLATRLRFAPTTCVNSDRLGSKLGNGRFIRLAGRGRYTEGGSIFLLECVYRVEPLSSTPELES